MKMWFLNIITITKSTDLYDYVSVNKYPLLFKNYESKEELVNFLKSNKDFNKYLKKSLKSKYLYENSKLCIRLWEDEDYDMKNIIDFEIDVKGNFDIVYK